jgi:hypothetical protein
MRIQEKSKLHEYYHERSIAYGRIFDPESPFTELVMADLARFCRSNETTFHTDARVHALMEGRREVFLRIQEFLTLNADQLLEKHTKPLTITETPKP